MKNCTLEILGKNGESLFQVSLPFDSDSPTTEDIFQALSKSDLTELSNQLNNNEGVAIDTLGSIVFGPADKKDLTSKILGNYNSGDIIPELKQRGVNLSKETVRLLDTVQQVVKDANFILLTNNKIQGSYEQNQSFPIKGSVLRYGLEKPLLVIDGTDTETIDSTLRHELVHFLWDKIIESDSAIQNELKALLDTMRNSKDSNIKNLVSYIDRSNKSPKEIFAYSFSDNYGYNYIKDEYPTLFNKLNNEIPILEPNTQFSQNKPPYGGLKTIISGFQTGIDQLGVKIGKDLGYSTGGTAAPGFAIEGGGNARDLASEYGVSEISAELQGGKSQNQFYLPRTEQNVINSDATVYYATDADSGGRRATEGFAKKYKKPFILNPTAEELKDFIKKNKVETLNVAGNRGSKASQDLINAATESLTGALKKDVVKSREKDNSKNIPQDSDNYEVSSKGDKRFSALHAKFAPGTIIDGHDVGGRTIESVYQHGIKQNDWITDNNSKTGAPGPLSKLYKPSKEPIKNAIFNKELIKLGRVKVLKSTKKIREVDKQRQKEAGEINIVSRQRYIFNTLIPIVGLKNYNSINELDDLKINSKLKSRWIKLIDSAKNGVGILAAESNLTLESSKNLNINPKKAAKEFYNLQLEHTKLLKETALEIWGVEPEYTTSNNIFDDKLIEDNNEEYYIQSKDELENFSYEVGYLPLWEEWAKQNPELIKELKTKSQGKTLTDQFASSRVSQARALTEIIKTIDTSPYDFSEDQIKAMEELLTQKPGEMSFLAGSTAISNDKKLPRLVRSETGYGYDNVEDAYNYLENNKGSLSKYWSEPKPVNKFALRELSAGDVLAINNLQWFDAAKLKSIGMGDGINGALLSLDDVMSKLEAIKDRTKTQDAFLKNANNIKYRKYTPNYILAGVFFSKKENKRIGIIPMKFGENIKQVFIDLDTVKIKHYRSLDPNHKTTYEYENGKVKLDEKGQPVIKSTTSDIDADFISAVELDAAKESLDLLTNKIKKGIKNESESPILDQFISKNGNAYYRQSKYGIMISGYAGDLIDQAKESNAGDYVRYQSKWTIEEDSLGGKKKKPVVELGVKIKNVPGGIYILTESGERKIIPAESVVTVVFNKDLFKSRMAEQVESLRILSGGINGKNRRAYTEAAKANPNISIYPYWSNDLDKTEMNKNVKKGDIVEVRIFPEAGKPQDILATVLYATSTHIYYTTKSDEYPVIGVETKNTTDEKWINQGTKEKPIWKYGTLNNGNFVQSTSKTPIVRAVYQENYDAELKEYLGRIKDLHKESFGSNKTILNDTGIYGLDSLTDALVGENFGNNIMKGDDGKWKIPLSKTSIDSEWDVTYTEGLDQGSIIDMASDLIKGDIILSEFADESGKKIKFWGSFRGYNSKTGEPKIIGINSKGRSIGCTVQLDRILGVGKRTLPIVRFEQNGEVKFANTSDIKTLSKIEGVTNVKIISEGRPELLNKLKDRVKEFVTKDMKIAQLTEKELESNQKRIQMLSKFDNPVTVTLNHYVNQETGEEYFSEQPFDKGILVNDGEKRYAIKMVKSDGKHYYLNNIDLNKDYHPLFGAGKYSFDQMKEVLTEGDYVKYEIKKKDGELSYYGGVVTNISNGYIEMSLFKRSETGMTPIKIPWFKKSDNIRIVKANVKDVKKAIEVNAKESNLEQTPKKVIKKVNKSKTISELKKSYDSRETIVRVATKLKELYDSDAYAYTSSEMSKLGNKLGVEMEGTRAFAMDGKIFINVDVASTADYLHEMTHILLPGLKTMNPEAYKVLMSKIKQHPSYNTIKSAYPNLTTEDLDEEVFCTIFGEYFREKSLAQDKEAWLSGDFEAFTGNVPTVLSELFEADVNSNTVELMNMSIDDILMGFGSAMIKGDYVKAYKLSAVLHSNSFVQKTYQHLIDTGTIKKIC